MSGEVRLELSAVIMNSAQSRGLPMRKEQPEKVRMTQLHFRRSLVLDPLLHKFANRVSDHDVHFLDSGRRIRGDTEA